MANKFIKNLTSSDSAIKEQRATIIAEEAQAAQTELIQTLKKEKRKLDSKLMNLEDMHGETTVSLNPVKEGFDANKWVKELQDTKIAILNKGVEIDTAEETYNEWFADVEA